MKHLILHEALSAAAYSPLLWRSRLATGAKSFLSCVQMKLSLFVHLSESQGMINCTFTLLTCPQLCYVELSF